ncbi:MAG: GspE/PulE family protein [Myxococcota bacterium]|nr:GspE/PulE family protein [Myxococcota bacterium]
MARTTIDDFSELSQFKIVPAAVRQLPLPFATQKRVVILGEFNPGSEEEVTLGMANPNDLETIHLLSSKWHREIKPVQLTPFEINKALDQGYGDGLAYTNEHVVNMRSSLVTLESTIPEQVDDVLLRAVGTGASDIHIESYQDDVDVRLRVDGVLHQLQTFLSPENIAAAVSRIKVLAQLDIGDRRIAQDGRISVVVVDGERKNPVDFRVSILPGPAGEDAVLRVLNPMTGLMPMDKLGFSEEHSKDFQALVENPEGAIFVTGPTGSGKTTTLYSALMHLNNGRRKVLTAEDPIEYRLDKINQKQVTPSLTMSNLARAFLRQDPDVILIGEVRDQDTAETVSKAASTGHLVLSTLHTGDCFGVVPRLQSLGLEEDEIAESLVGVLAQRLVRRNCKYCKAEQEVSERQASLLGTTVSGATYYAGQGCEHCFETGYRGRAGLYELLVVDEELQDAIARSEPTTTLRTSARNHGFKTLFEDGITKAQAGDTSLDELIRVVPFRQIKAMTEQG